LNKALSQNQLDHLLEFIGYGRLDADIWFISMEELGSDEEKVRTRLKFEQVDDISKTIPQPDEKAPISGLRGMCEIVLRLDNINPTNDLLKEYQSDHLGRLDGSTLLCTLMPVPNFGDDEIIYKKIIPQYASQKACYEAIKTDRFDLFRQLIEENRPKIVIAAGSEYWSEYQELFNQFTFSDHDQFLVGWDTDTVVILTGELDSPEMQEKFVEIVSIIHENALSIDTSTHSKTPIVSEAEIKRQKKLAARQTAVAKRKPSATHDPADPYCVCAYCLKYEANE